MKLHEEIEQQDNLVKKINASLEESHSDELELKLNRERDKLRHLRQVQKGGAKDRGLAKLNYAAMSTLSRAIQPIEE